MEAQIESLKAQTAQSYSSTSRLEEDELNNKLPQHHTGELDYLFAREMSITQSSVSDTNMNPEVMLHLEDVLLNSNSFQSSQHSYTSYDNQFSITTDANSSCTVTSLDLQANAMRSTYQDMDDLHSVAFGYLNCA